MAKIPVNPDVLVWAREERGLGISEAAERLRISTEELEGFEQGKDQPSLGLLRDMAAKYQIGFSSLLMPERLPKTTRLKVEDFRTHAGGKPKWSAPLLALLDNLNIVVDDLAELRDFAPDLFTKLDELPKITLSSDPEEIAASERQRLGPKELEQLGWETEARAFKHFRAIIESQGVFVYVMKAGAESEWRGLSIIDKRQIPTIVINSKEDEYAPRIFSLLHEYCHILLRHTALSDENRKNVVEKFCNQFAAYYLMPRDRFIQEASLLGPPQGEDWPDETIKRLSRKFKSSMSAVALHLEEVRLASAGLYERKLMEWRLREKKTKTGGQSEYPERIANRLGVRHIETVLAALEAGHINQIDANEMLFDVKPEHFKPLKKEIEERQAAYGRNFSVTNVPFTELL